MALRPLGDRLIIKREASNEKSTGGIILPEAAKKKPQRGTVLAVGPGQMNVGDRFFFTSCAGDEFQDRNRKDEVLVMHESDILAVLA